MKCDRCRQKCTERFKVTVEELPIQGSQGNRKGLYHWWLVCKRCQEVINSFVNGAVGPESFIAAFDEEGKRILTEEINEGKSYQEVEEACLAEGQEPVDSPCPCFRSW